MLFFFFSAHDNDFPRLLCAYACAGGTLYSPPLLGFSHTYMFYLFICQTGIDYGGRILVGPVGHLHWQRGIQKSRVFRDWTLLYLQLYDRAHCDLFYDRPMPMMVLQTRGYVLYAHVCTHIRAVLALITFFLKVRNQTESLQPGSLTCFSFLSFLSGNRIQFSECRNDHAD